MAEIVQGQNRSDKGPRGTVQGKAKMGWVILVIAAVIVGLGGWRLRDPWRDLTTNVASTEADAAEPDLRPLAVSIPVGVLAARVARWAAEQPHWRVESVSDSNNPAQLHLVRTTRWLRFQDDIHVTIQTDAITGGAMLTARSRSRIGKGDLGQNPRNLKELIGGLRQQLARPPAD